MASRAITPTGEGRVCTSTTSAFNPCPRVIWFVGLASVIARAGSATRTARASAGATTMLLDMGGSWSKSVKDRTRFQGLQPDGRGSDRSDARLASGLFRTRYGAPDARWRLGPCGRSSRVDVDRGRARARPGGFERDRAVRVCAHPPRDAQRLALDVHGGGVGQYGQCSGISRGLGRDPAPLAARPAPTLFSAAMVVTTVAI